MEPRRANSGGTGLHATESMCTCVEIHRGLVRCERFRCRLTPALHQGRAGASCLARANFRASACGAPGSRRIPFMFLCHTQQNKQMTI